MSSYRFASEMLPIDLRCDTFGIVSNATRFACAFVIFDGPNGCSSFSNFLNLALDSNIFETSSFLSHHLHKLESHGLDDAQGWHP